MEPLRRAFRGYETAQVDRLVSGLYSQLEARLRELEEARSHNARLEQDLSEFHVRSKTLESDERAVQSALVSAHRQADEVLAQARKDADTLLQVAREAASRYQDDLRGRIDDLNWQIERLTLQKQRFIEVFRTLLEGHLADLADPQTASVQPSVLHGTALAEEVAAESEGTADHAASEAGEVVSAEPA